MEFNNGLFQNIYKNFSENKLVQEIYKDLHKPTKQNLRDLFKLFWAKTKANDELKDFYNSKTLEIIKNIISRGFSPKIFAYLSEKKKEGLIISKYLIENDIPVISSDTLNISSSKEVNLIIRTFQIYM